MNQAKTIAFIALLVLLSACSEEKNPLREKTYEELLPLFNTSGGRACSNYSFTKMNGKEKDNCQAYADTTDYSFEQLTDQLLWKGYRETKRIRFNNFNPNNK